MKFRHPALLSLLPPLAAQVFTGIFRSCQESTRGQQQEAAFLSRGQPVLYTVWHGQLAYVIYYFRHRQGILMVSPSFDGQLLGRTAGHLGYILLHGSRHKGGARVIRDMAAHLRRGRCAGLIADGSRGPRHKVQKGPLVLARETRAPLLPLAVAASRKVTLNTWDRFELPLPFGRVAMLFGEPLHIPPDARGPHLEFWRRELQDRLLRLYRQSQEYFS